MRKAFLITRETDSEYGHINVRAIELVKDVPRNIDYLTTPELADFEVLCQMDNHTDKAYGWGCRYKPFTVGLDRAKAMAKTLKAISRKRNKMSGERGYERCFSEFVGRVAEALKIKEFVWRVQGDGPRYSDNVYHIDDPAMGLRYIDKLEKEIISKLSNH